MRLSHRKTYFSPLILCFYCETCKNVRKTKRVTQDLKLVILLLHHHRRCLRQIYWIGVQKCFYYFVQMLFIMLRRATFIQYNKVYAYRGIKFTTKVRYLFVPVYLFDRFIFVTCSVCFAAVHPRTILKSYFVVGNKCP